MVSVKIPHEEELFQNDILLTEACFEHFEHFELAGDLQHSSVTISMCQVQQILTDRRIGGATLAESLGPDIVPQMESEIPADKVFTGREVIPLDDSRVSLQNAISKPLLPLRRGQRDALQCHFSHSFVRSVVQTLV